MAKAFNGFISDDGKKIGTRDQVLRYEIDREIRTQFPGMKSTVQCITDNLDWWATLLARVPLKTEKPPLEAPKPPQTTVDHGELSGLCDCAAAMNGLIGHITSCPAYRPKIDLTHPAYKPGMSEAVQMVRDEGRRAHDAGNATDANPYDDGSLRHQLWARGYAGGVFDAKLDTMFADDEDEVTARRNAEAASG